MENIDFILDKLNPAQRQAATTTDGILRLIAVAGSGKTTTLMARVAYMISQNIDPSSILLLTFTNEAADNMKNRIAKIIDEDKALQVTACTFHSFAAQELRRYSQYINISENFTIITPSDSATCLSIIKAQDKTYKIKGFPKNSLLQSVFSYAVNANISITEAIDIKCSKFNCLSPVIEKLFSDYVAYKKQKNLLDYDDLLVLYNNALSSKQIFLDFKSRFKYIMVDEYQDTNNLQENILTSMSIENLCIVGDDYQSIFKFRAANVNNILDFNKKFTNCQDIVIDINYRSSDKILSIANYMMNNFATFGIKKVMRGVKGDIGITEIRDYDNETMQAKAVFNDIKKHLASGKHLSDICILIRNGNFSYSLELLLNNEGIEFEKHGGKSFLETEEIIDFLSFLRVIRNPTDSLAFFTILKLLPGVGDYYANKLISLISSHNKNFLINNQFKKYNFYNELESLDLFLKTVSNKPFNHQLHDIFNFYKNLKYRVLEKANFDDESIRTEKLEYLDTVVSDNIRKVITIASTFNDISTFLDYLTLNRTRPENSQNDKLYISTIHSAKGLEFDTVYLINASDVVFPNICNTRKEDNEEDLRLLYVAVTRAKNNLIITYPRNTMVNGKTFSCRKSPWIK